MSIYKKTYAIFEKEYLMYAMIGVLVSSGLGAAAAMIILHQGHGLFNMIQVGLLVAVCMGYNATILADQKPKIVFNWGILSVVTSIILLFLHLIFI